MEKFKGTKGGWRLSEDGIILNEHLVKTQSIDFSDRQKDCVDVYIGPDDNEDELLANARLIIAAPDLLNALSSLIDPLTGLVYDEICQLIGCEESLDIEEAINKALGK